MSKFKRTDKKRPILVNKQTKIFDLFPGGAYASGLKVKDFKGVMKSRKKGNKMGGVIKASTGGDIVTPRMSRYVADTLKSADEGAFKLGSKIKEKGKGFLSGIKEKISRAGEIMRKGPTIASATGIKTPEKAKAVGANIAKAMSGNVGKGTSKALVTSRTAKLFKATRFVRAATPVGLAVTAVAAGVKKRDPKAVKRERDFYKGKKYKDVGFESMMDYAKPKSKGGAISYNKGGFNYAINRKR